MSALAEALVAAQRRALAALEKAYVAGRLEPDALTEQLDAIGCHDEVDRFHLIESLNVIRSLGADLPSEPKPSKPERSTPTKAQLDYMAKLAGERNYVMPDDPQLLTRDQASQVIESMKQGEYDQAAWSVPF